MFDADVMIDDLIDAWTRKVNGVVPDIEFSADVDADMLIMIAVLDFTALSPSLEELLLFSWTAFRC